MDWTVLSNSDRTTMRSPLNSFRDGDLLVENTDDYIVGDRVWVNGRKPGYIQYLGETQFASGDWAGVVLDDPIGKNDGSVAGIRYFQCEPKKGVFARLNNLTRYPTSPPSKYDVHTTVNGTNSKTTTTKVMNSPKGNKTVVTTTITSNSPSKSPRLRIADRVLVNATSGVRTGVLRYIGPTAFASGQWAGVELDEPVGKNDGSVAGKRYFDCRMKYGLFAPFHKITKISSGSYMRVSSPVQRSHESLTTSTTSSRTTMKSPVITSMQSTTSAMQEALKEKEEHLEQLLRERDLERGEVARAASEIKQAEVNLGTLQAEHDQYMEQSEYNIAYLRQLLDASEQERKELAARLDEEKRKVEDLQFRIEEETIIKDDLGSEEPSNLDHTRKSLLSHENNRDEEKNGEIYSDQETDKDDYIRKLQNQLDDRESQMMQLNATLQETQLKLEQLADSYVSRNTVNHQISQLQAENILLSKDKEDILERWEKAERINQLLEGERDQLLRERVEQQAAVSDRDLQVAQLKAEVERLRLEFAQHKEDLKQQLEQTEIETQAMQDLHQQLELERDALDELQDELRTTMNERDKLKQELLALKRDHELLRQSKDKKEQENEITR